LVAGRSTFSQEGTVMVEGSNDDVNTAAEQQGLRLSGGAIASLSGGALLIIFMIQNTEDVTLDFLVWSFTWPLWLLVLVSALAGALIWLGLGVIRRHRRRVARRDARRE
jgi:uncharacterized integral membrane protein